MGKEETTWNRAGSGAVAPNSASGGARGEMWLQSSLFLFSDANGIGQPVIGLENMYIRIILTVSLL